MSLNLKRKITEAISEVLCLDGKHCARTDAGGLAAHSHYARYLEPHLLDPHYGYATKITNRVYYSPIDIPETLTIDGIIILHAAIAAGNFYVAFYDSVNEAPVNRLAVSALTACNGINRKQIALFTSTLQVSPQYCFLAFQPTNNTDQYYHGVWPISVLEPAGVANGPTWYYEDPGAATPPATADPTRADEAELTVWQMLRVSSVP